MNIKFLFFSISITLCGCSQKVVIDQIFLEQDSPIGYTAITCNLKPKGDMLLFPGFGETSTDVLNATKLPEMMAKSGVAVFIPSLQNGADTYGFSNESQSCLTDVVDDIQKRYNLADIPYCVGGFSMGGATAIRYAELVENKPFALFAIDSPLDYKRFLLATKRDIELYHKDTEDGIYAKLYRDIEGIKDCSPYEIADTTHSAIMTLREVPVRYYIEPAEDWWLNNRRTDALGLNIIDGTCFINDLRLNGNDKADLILTRDRGYRKSTGQKHPHSWTIVDNKNLLNWINSLLMR
ncbi:MAG: alpha/beta hydrolase [Muribaculaceae bacterium]|nr:alpha/beta hydrolase [Muribaculaceae bacterium]